MKRAFIFYCCVLLVSFITVSAQQITVKEISAADFKKLVWNYEQDKSVVLQSKLPVIVDFYATWCGPCKLLSPLIDRLQQEYAGKIIIYRVDVDKNRDLAVKMGIRAMPTLMFFTKNKKHQALGYMSYDKLKQTAIENLGLK